MDEANEIMSQACMHIGTLMPKKEIDRTQYRRRKEDSCSGFEK